MLSPEVFFEFATRPSPIISFLIYASSNSVLLSIYRFLSSLYRLAVLNGRSEVECILAEESQYVDWAYFPLEGSKDTASISPSLLWRIHFNIEHSSSLKDSRLALRNPDFSFDKCHDVANLIALKKLARPSSQSLSLLRACILRIRVSYTLTHSLASRASQSYDPHNSDHEMSLRTLWTLLLSEHDLKDLVDKRWQDIGFQGKDPTTDLRGMGMLGVDCLVYFAETYPDAPQIVKQAVQGGAHWYPFAIVSISMTSFLLRLLKQQSLSFLGFASLSSASNFDPRANFFHSTHARLMMLFHEYWIREKPNVMEFEGRFKIFSQEAQGWLERGVVGGNGIGWREPFP